MGWVSRAWDNVTDGDNWAALRSGLVDGAAGAATSIYNGGVAVKDGAVAFGGWTKNTAAPWVGNGIAYTAAGAVAVAEEVIIAVPNASRALWNGGAAALDYVGVENDASVGYIQNPNFLGWDRVDEAHQFIDYVDENPGRAAALATQGIINGGTSIVGAMSGLIVDAGRLVVNTADVVLIDGIAVTAGNAGVGIVNLGREDDNKTDYFEREGAARYGSVFATTAGNVKWLNDHIQLKNGIALSRRGLGAVAELGLVNPVVAKIMDGGLEHAGYAFERPQMQINVDENGDRIYGPRKITDASGNEINNPAYANARLVNNPNYGYERGISYGGQALFEVPAFTLMTIGTGGTAGVALAAARTTSLGTKTMSLGARVKDIAARSSVIVDDTVRVIADDGAVLATEGVNTATIAGVNTTTSTGVNAAASTGVNTASTGLNTAASTGLNTASGTANAVNAGVNTATTASAAGAEAATISGRSAEMVHRAQLVGDALKANERAFKATQAGQELTGRAANGAAIADDIVRGNRAGTLLDGSRVTNPFVTSGARALERADAIEYLAKYAQALRNKTAHLDELKDAGVTSGRQFDNAERAVTRAQSNLTRETDRVNFLGSRQPGFVPINEAQARAATHQITERGVLDGIMESYNVGALNGFTHVGDFSRGWFNRAAEGAGAGLAFSMGYKGDKANAEAEAQGVEKLLVDGVGSTLSAPITDDFNGVQASGSGGPTTTEFNNGATAAREPLNDSVIRISLDKDAIAGIKLGHVKL